MEFIIFKCLDDERISNERQDLNERQDSNEPPAKTRNVELNEPINYNKAIPRLLNGKYFVIARRDKFKVIATCTICGKNRKGDIRSTGNFMDHYKTSHPTIIEEVEKHRKEKDDEKAPTMKQTTLVRPISALCTEVVSSAH